MKTLEFNVAHIERLAGQVAKTQPAAEALQRAKTAAAAAQTRGWSIRKGSTSTSSRNAMVHVYASKDGQPEIRIWSADRMRSGYFAPLTGPKLTELVDAMHKLA